MFCVLCGSELEDDAVFCANCGEKISKDSTQKFCPWCGSDLDDDSVFCSGCGKKIKSDDKDAENDSSKQHKKRGHSEKSDTTSPSQKLKTKGKVNQDCWTSVYVKNKLFVCLKDNPEVLYCPNCHNFASPDDSLCSFCNQKFVNDEKSEAEIHCDALVNKSNEVVTDVNANGMEISQASISEDVRVDNTSFTENKTSNVAVWTVVFALAAIIGFSIAYYNYNVINQCNDIIEKKDEDLLKQKEDFERRYASLLEYNNSVFVRFDRFTNNNGATYLDHKYITYLRIHYSVINESHSSTSNKSYIKVKDPYGRVLQGASCPNGYSAAVESYSGVHYIGFGDSYPGTYIKGTYTIEFWNDNMCLCREKVRIN